jgi:hypothetical protein
MGGKERGEGKRRTGSGLEERLGRHCCVVVVVFDPARRKQSS